MSDPQTADPKLARFERAQQALRDARSEMADAMETERLARRERDEAWRDLTRELSENV